MDPILANLMAAAIVLIVSIAAAGLLRWAGAPGSAVIGGAMAGILLGPTIFGRTMPQSYEQLFIGGVHEREQFQQRERQHAADRLAALEAGMDREAVENLRRDHERELEQYRDALDAARWSHQQPLRVVTAAVVGLTLLVGGMMRVPPTAAAQSWGSAMSIGMWAAALPGALAFLVMRWWWQHDLHSSALVAAAVMIGPWALTMVDRNAADMAEQGGAWMIQAAGRIATVIAMAIAGWALWSAHGIEHALWAGALLALPLGWLIGRLVPVSPERDAAHATEDRSSETEPSYNPLHLIAQHAFLPALAGCAAVKIELFEHFAFWPLLVLLLLSGDGRWLGAVTGALLLGGRSGLRTMRLVLGSMACGPTQLAVLAIAVHLWALPDELPLAMLLGAIVIDATTPARRRIAEQLVEAETEISDIDQT